MSQHNQNPDGTEPIDYDGFGDVVVNSNGIFGMGGLEPTLKKHDSVKHDITEKGLILEIECQGCGAASQICVEYPELIALRYGVNPAKALQGSGVLEEPTNWVYVKKENSWRPDMKCPHCTFNICIRIGTDEPDHHLTNARRRGFVNPAMEQKVAAISNQVAARLRAGGR